MPRADDESDTRALAATQLPDTPPPARADETLRSGLQDHRLDHFRVGRKLGQGGMGAVYEGWDTSLDRPVAIKMLRDDVVRAGGQEERFLREARAQAKLNHPNVVHIYYIGHRAPPGGGTGQGSLYFAMERIDGDSLEELVERGETLHYEVARKYMIQVAQGLRAAARAGIIHRDVKPSNLMLDSDGFVKIADFGLAKPIGEDAAITQDGAMVGSPLYMAPEQARNLQVDQRADMYSLGATFFQLLTGRPPFEGSTALAVVAQHLQDAPPKVRELVPSVPLPLARIIDRLLEKDPPQRFADYDELLAALEAAAPSTTAYAGFWTRGAATVLDTGLAGILIALVGWPGLVVHLLHVTLAHAFGGQTLAKYFLNIRVQRRSGGGNIGLARSLLRTVVSLWAPVLAGVTILLAQGAGELIETIEHMQPQELDRVQNLVVALAISNGLMTLLYGSGLVLAAFHPQKRALHDLAVGSEVTYRLRGG